MYRLPAFRFTVPLKVLLPVSDRLPPPDLVRPMLPIICELIRIQLAPAVLITVKSEPLPEVIVEPLKFTSLEAAEVRRMPPVAMVSGPPRLTVAPPATLKRRELIVIDAGATVPDPRSTLDPEAKALLKVVRPEIFVLAPLVPATAQVVPPTVAQPPRMVLEPPVKSTLVAVVRTPLLADCVPVGSVKSTVPPVLWVKVLPRFKASGLLVEAVSTMAEAPGIRLVPLKVWLLVALADPVRVSVPPKARAEPALMMLVCAAVAALKFSVRLVVGLIVVVPVYPLVLLRTRLPP